MEVIAVVVSHEAVKYASDGAMNSAEGGEFVRLFCELDDHLNAHFNRDNTLMTLFSYPQTDEHR